MWFSVAQRRVCDILTTCKQIKRVALVSFSYEGWLPKQRRGVDLGGGAVWQWIHASWYDSCYLCHCFTVFLFLLFVFLCLSDFFWSLWHCIFVKIVFLCMCHVNSSQKCQPGCFKHKSKKLLWGLYFKTTATMSKIQFAYRKREINFICFIRSDFNWSQSLFCVRSPKRFVYWFRFMCCDKRLFVFFLSMTELNHSFKITIIHNWKSNHEGRNSEKYERE